MVTLTDAEVTFGLVLLAIVIGGPIMFWHSRCGGRANSQSSQAYKAGIDARIGRFPGSGAKGRASCTTDFETHPLSAARRDVFIDDWRRVQTLFVDDPAGAIMRADVLLSQVMESRGYPVTDFEQRSADLAIEHGHVVEHYRTAHGISERQVLGEAGIEDLRRALIHYRALFDDLVNEPTDDQPIIATRAGRIVDLRTEPLRRN